MKRVVLFFAALVTSLGALAFTPDQYAGQVLQKDLPRSLRWFGKMAQSHELNQVEVYGLYQAALPETQVNHQLGISVKGSVERMLLLLDGARYFEQVRSGSLDYQNKKEIVTRVLQTTKDQMDRFQYGEDPQILLEEWMSLGVMDFAKFTADLVETFTETQRLLSLPVIAPVEQRVDAQVMPTDENVSEVDVVVAEQTIEIAVPAPATAAAPSATPVPEESFEKQRFNSYVQSAESGQVAGECRNAYIWKTDQAESCQSDDTLECDRSYARQCKKLQ